MGSGLRQGGEFGRANAAFRVVHTGGSTVLVATAPANAAGGVDVTVTNAIGTGAPSTASKFTYVPPPPTVTRLSVSSVTYYGGTRVRVTGTSLTGATSVRVGYSWQVAPRVLSDTTLEFVTPALRHGVYDVIITTPSGSSAPGDV